MAAAVEDVELVRYASLGGMEGGGGESRIREWLQVWGWENASSVRVDWDIVGGCGVLVSCSSFCGRLWLLRRRSVEVGVGIESLMMGSVGS